jgi:prepilin-type N-terminal cleavage/methylation domain-containing protein
MSKNRYIHDSYSPAPSYKRSLRLGFSLVELSIVLVILGLLIGGILSGQALIRAAELRSITTDMTRYQVAVGSFRDKYFALPGDMPNAIAFWGAADGNDGGGSDCTYQTTAPTGTQTCNGDGNGRSELATNEPQRLWQHLQNAGLIEGKLSGAHDPSFESGTYPYRDAVLGWNMPKSKINNAGFQIGYRGGSAALKWGVDTHQILFGAQQVIAGSLVELEGAAITPEEAWNLDMKMDDGKPFEGHMRTYPYNWYLKYCSNSADTEYDLSNKTVTCALAWRLNY